MFSRRVALSGGVLSGSGSVGGTPHRGVLAALALFLLLVAVNAEQASGPVPELQIDQPVRVQPGPSLVDADDYDSKVKDYAARALEILTTRARVQKRKSKYRYRSRSLKTADCEERYEQLSSSHTMCLRDVGTEVSLSTKQKKDIVNQHNLYRSRVSPTASNMQVMVWDDSLATIAGKWSRFCQLGHDKGADRLSPDLPEVYIGQNAAYGYRTWHGAIKGWHNEVSNFKYGNGSIDNAVVGHYTQVVAWRSARLGCGQANCPKSKYGKHFVCNYAQGQLFKDTVTPYQKGGRCADCPDHCDKDGNMCDCGGKVCFNRGKIDIRTCECTCPSLYCGDRCQTLQCPAKDKSFCGSQYPPKYCQKYDNVPQECPYMCNLCSSNSSTTPTSPLKCRIQCKNRGKVHPTKCTCVCPEGTTGKHCERKAATGCSTGRWCNNKGKICGGRVCKNRGSLNTNTCQCSCPPGFSGEVCQNRRCPGVTCHNGGKLDYSDCSCLCAGGFYGKQCKRRQQLKVNSGRKCKNTCQNGGLPDPVTCRCWCAPPFMGKTCQRVYCERRDHEVCDNFPETYCSDYFLMKYRCPFKCALC